MNMSGPRLQAMAIEHRQKELLDSSDAEKRRVGHELHDDIAQQLVGISFLLKGLKQKLLNEGRHEAEAMDMAEADLNQAARQVLALARRLTPLEMAGGDFLSSIEALAFHAEAVHSINCEFRTEGHIPALKQSEAWQLHNIIQIALADARSGDKASSACISLAASAHQLILTLRSNGLTFPSLSAWSKGRKMGLLDHRARSIGAFLEVNPRHIGGTLLICVLPLPG